MKIVKKIAVALNIFIILGCSPNSTNTADTTPSTQSSKPDVNISKKLDVYFSKTEDSQSSRVDKLIISDIKSAKDTIYLAMYNFNNEDIEEAIIDAYNRGVAVKIVTDDDQHQNTDANLYDELEQVGIDVEDDEGFGRGLMHNKILVIDGNIAWSGSANYTYASFYNNWENFIRFTDKDTIQKYKEQIDELLNKEQLAGSLKQDSLELYFSPEDSFKSARLLKLIDSAKRSINFMVFLINDKDIKDALIRAKNRGVEIHGVFDKKQTSFQYRYTQYNNLKDANIDVKQIGDSWHKLHNKVIIIDNQIVVTGSYNFSYTSDSKNNENSIVIYDRNIAKKYIDKFNEIYQKASN